MSFFWYSKVCGKFWNCAEAESKLEMDVATRPLNHQWQRVCRLRCPRQHQYQHHRSQLHVHQRFRRMISSSHLLLQQQQLLLLHQQLLLQPQHQLLLLYYIRSIIIFIIIWGARAQ